MHDMNTKVIFKEVLSYTLYFEMKTLCIYPYGLCAYFIVRTVDIHFAIQN